METIYNLIKSHSNGKGEDMMWRSTAIISDSIEKWMPEKNKKELYDELFGLMSGGHYDKDMAVQDVEKMYYVDEADEKHYGPYLEETVVKELFDGVSAKVAPYNMWDFYVTLHMIVSDYHNILLKWFPDDTKEERVEKYVELAVNWLKDPDQESTDRIWAYLH